MSQAAATVSVVTTDGPAGRAGVTVSAMTSVSADTDRPTLLVCVHRLSKLASAVLENEVFCVNVLKNDQIRISEVFAGRLPAPESGDRFDCCDWTRTNTGAPRVANPLVAFDCQLVDSRRVGTHHVFFGAVEDVFLSTDGSPLIYANRAYGTPTPDSQAAKADAESRSAALRVGCHHSLSPFLVPEALAALSVRMPDLEFSLVEGDEDRLVSALATNEIEAALMFEFDFGEDIAVESLGDFRPRVLFARSHPLAGRKAIGIVDLAGESLILTDTDLSRVPVLDLFEREGRQPLVRTRLASFEAACGMVGLAMGYCILTTIPAGSRLLEGRNLVSLPLEIDCPPTRTVLAWKRDTVLSDAARGFAGTCRQVIAGNGV